MEFRPWLLGLTNFSGQGKSTPRHRNRNRLCARYWGEVFWSIFLSLGLAARRQIIATGFVGILGRIGRTCVHKWNQCGKRV